MAMTGGKRKKIPLWASIFLAMLIIGTYNYSYLLRKMYKSMPNEPDGFNMTALEDSIMKDMFAMDNATMGGEHHAAAVRSVSPKTSSLTSSSQQQPP